MSPVDRAVLRRKLDRIVKCLLRIRRAEGLTLDDYLRDEDLQAVMERQIELAIGAAVDLNVHLLSRSGFGTPPDGYSSFLELAKHTHAISPDLAAHLAPGVGLRNRIVHEYEEINQAAVFAGLHEALDLLPQYVSAIEDFLAHLPEERPDQ